MIFKILDTLGYVLNKILILLKNFIKLIIVIILALIVIFGFKELYQNVFHGYKYTSDIQCVNEAVNSKQSVDEVVYKYETGASEILLYYSEDKKLHVALLEKKVTDDGLRYRSQYSYGFKNGEVFENDYTVEDSKLVRFNSIRYTFLQNKEDLAHFDVNEDNTTLVELENIRNDGSIEKFWACFVLDD